jgi:hypothetical protein
MRGRACPAGGACRVARVVRKVPAKSPNPLMDQPTDKPTWIDALEESLLLAIGLFSLITWIITISLLAH